MRCRNFSRSSLLIGMLVASCGVTDTKSSSNSDLSELSNQQVEAVREWSEDCADLLDELSACSDACLASSENPREDPEVEVCLEACADRFACALPPEPTCEFLFEECLSQLPPDASAEIEARHIMICREEYEGCLNPPEPPEPCTENPRPPSPEPSCEIRLEDCLSIAPPDAPPEVLEAHIMACREEYESCLNPSESCTEDPPPSWPPPPVDFMCEESHEVCRVRVIDPLQCQEQLTRCLCVQEQEDCLRSCPPPPTSGVPDDHIVCVEACLAAGEACMDS